MSTAIAEAPKQKMTLRDQLQSDGMKKHLAMALPKHLTPDRMIRVALTTITRTPKLAECDQASFFQALFQCSQWGLEPDGRRAHLIPFENKQKKIVECQLIIDYKGLVELAYRSGFVQSIHAQEVRDGDIFDFNMGQVLKHVPHAFRRDPGRPAKPGEIYAYYCIVQMVGDSHKCEVMSIDEVNAIRDRSQGYQAAKKYNSNSSPWIAYPIEMGKKTVFRRCSKWLPLSAEFRSAVDHDDVEYVEAVEGPTQTIDGIAGLLASEAPTIPDGVADDGEIIFAPDAIATTFAACVTEDDCRDKYLELCEIHPDHKDEITRIESERRAMITKRNKPKDGKLPMGG